MSLFKIWKQYMKCNIAKFMEYRMDFFVGFTAMALSNAINILFFFLLFQFTPDLNGWSFWQVLFIYGLTNSAMGVWHTFLIGVSPHRMERFIQNGELDRLILHPINLLTHLYIRYIDDDGFGDLLPGFLVLFYSAAQLGIVWDIWKILTLIYVLAGGILILCALFTFMSAVGFWTVRAQWISNIFWNLMEFTDYPIAIFGKHITNFLTFVIPVGFIGFYPAQIFLGTGQYLTYAYLAPIVGIVCFFIAVKFWDFGLKNYTSTGS